MNQLDTETLIQRSAFFQKVRSFFLDAGYLEIDTPHMVRHPSLEPYLDPYTLKLDHDQSGVLITSPEFSLKKNLRHDCPRIFEIAHAYRKDEPGPWHSSEFRMLEWYTINQDLEQLIEQCQDLLSAFFQNCPFQVIQVEDWFHRNYGHGFTPDDMKSTLQKQGVQQLENMDPTEMFFRLFLPTESKLKTMGIVVLKDYPAEQSAYAQKSGHLAKRFEIYIHGIEVANAYLEEKDSEKLRAQLLKEQNERLRLKKETFEMDEGFINALRDISEPISGIAMGLDRVFALTQGKTSLDEVSPFKNYSRLT